MNVLGNEFLLASEMGLDLPVFNAGGQFGDLKADGRLSGDEALDFQPLDAGSDSLFESGPSGGLGMEWMENADLGSLFDALGGSTDHLLPLEVSLLDCSQPDSDLQQVAAPPIEVEVKVVDCLDDQANALQSFGQESNFDALLLSPESIEQVTPVISLEAPRVSQQDCRVDALAELLDCAGVQTSAKFNVGDNLFGLNTSTNTLNLEGFDFIDVGNSPNASASDDTDTFVSSPLSANDVESFLCASAPSSPESSRNSSLILSSPELYKVISTSSAELSKRHSPYSRQKPAQRTKNDSKATRKAKTPSQNLSDDDIILEHLSKKDRKKLQNKNAAIRYRQKKKEEAAGIKSEEELLEEANQNLKTKVEDLQREIKYMKNLMEDVCKAKGIPFSFKR